MECTMRKSTHFVSTEDNSVLRMSILIGWRQSADSIIQWLRFLPAPISLPVMTAFPYQAGCVSQIHVTRTIHTCGQTFLQNRAAFILMTVKWATSLRIVRKYTLPQSSIFFGFESGILNSESGRSSRAALYKEKLWKWYENGKDALNQVNILCPV